MVEFKVNISHKGKAKQIVVKDDVAAGLMGKKIGEKLNGELVDLTGYELEITGGSDEAGKAMRADLPGPVRKRVLAVSGVGIKAKGSGQRQRKLVSGNTVFEKTAQINMKVLKLGKDDIFAEKKEEEAPAEKTE